MLAEGLEHHGDIGPVQIWKVDADCGGRSLAVATSLVSAEERERAARYRFELDRRRFVVCRAALRTVLAQRLGGEPQRIQFSYGPNGKPFVQAAGLEFNVSHSGPLALIALSEQGPVGIDLEQIRDLADGGQGVARYFSESERAALAALPAAARQEGFYRLWVRKEAVLKALGLGIGAGLDRFSVSVDPGQDAIVADDMAGWRVPLLSIKGHAAAVAWRLV